MSNPDYWVRQVTANTGHVGHDEAMRALALIGQNMARGWYPTIGGAVPLMAKDDVDALYSANRGLFPKFRPQIPDRSDRPAKALSDWYVAAIEQALFSDEYQLDPRYVMATDGFLHTYHASDIDWKRIHDYAVSVDPTVPPFGRGGHWTRDGEPMSVRAFLGESVA